MTINAELRDERAARLDRFATGLHKSRGEATAQLIEEGLRHAEFPAIEFRDSAAGRQAYVVGSGLAVWEVLMVAEGYGLEFGATVQHLRIDRDHVIALNEQHLRRLVRDYVSYHHHDRIHDALDKDTPNRRLVEEKPTSDAVVISNARLGGLHHRYAWREAA